jgi:hypothetical protein
MTSWMLQFKDIMSLSGIFEGLEDLSQHFRSYLRLLRNS